MGVIPAYLLPITIKGEEYVHYSSYKESIDKRDRTIDELIDRVSELEKELSIKKMKDMAFRHQSDCITINQLQTTMDVLVDKLARLREVHGL